MLDTNFDPAESVYQYQVERYGGVTYNPFVQSTNWFVHCE